MKHRLQRIIRWAHIARAPVELPRSLGLYFHALERPDHRAFTDVIGRLRSAGYRLTGDPADHLAAKDKVAWISFDDNYRSWHSSLKLLEQLEVKATFYVNTWPLRGIAGPTDSIAFFDRVGHQGERVALSVPELIDLADAGHVIGAHTHTHRNLSDVPKTEAIAEISENIDRLRQVLSTEVEHFAVPFGLHRYFPPSLVPPCQDRGITTIAYATPGMQYAPRQPLALYRTPWRFTRPADENWDDLRVDGRAFVRLTGRSPVG